MIGSVSFPVVALIGVVAPLMFPTIGFYDTLIFQWGYMIALFAGFYESFNGIAIIEDARAQSVVRVKKVVNIGWVLCGVFFAILFFPLMISLATSVEVPFYEVRLWIGNAALVSWALVFGVCSLIVWDRWSSLSVEELDIRYWENLSRRGMIGLVCRIGIFAGFVLSVLLPAVGLAVMAAASVPFIFLTLTGKKTQVEHRPPLQGPPEKVELRKVSRKERLSIGEQICDLILSQYGRRRVHAVCIWGDTAEDPDLPYSSLDLLVVVRDGIRLPSEQYVFSGLLVGVNYWQEIQILHRAREFDENWPWHTDRLRKRIVLFEKKGWLHKLDRALEESDKADSAEPIRDTALKLVEDFGDLRNARLENDESWMKMSCGRIAWSTVTLVFLLDRRYLRKGWEDVFECQAKPSDFRRLFETAVGFISASLEERIQAAEKLFVESLELAGTRGISLTSPQLQI
ncbi:MAG: hypothetical protein AUJ07_02555 [Crenarchaeota archaeon 13_1_40CM_3_53_5]|nr:MAG: hypothetical protein AUJ07_02555 [Crenarchaeota archaeon 13_1_40CM_3_53_5]